MSGKNWGEVVVRKSIKTRKELWGYQKCKFGAIDSHSWKVMKLKNLISISIIIHIFILELSLSYFESNANAYQKNYSSNIKQIVEQKSIAEPTKNNKISDIIIGAIGSLLALLVQIIVLKTIRYLRIRAISSFWVLGNKPVTIVHPIHHDEFGKPISEDFARMEIVLALNLLITFFHNNRIQYTIQSDSKSLPSDSNIVLISSPKGNRQSEYMYDKLALPFAIVKNNETFFYRHKASSIDYESPVDRSNEKTDIGLVARIVDKSANRNIYLLWGIHLPGTVSSVKFVTTPDKLRDIRGLTKDKDVVLLVQSQYNNGLDIGDPTLLTQIP